MPLPKFPDAKDPDDISDFVLDFSEAITGDDVISAIDDVAVTPSNPGPVADSSAPDPSVRARLFSGQAVTIWLAGGKPGWRYEVSVLVRTLGGRVLRRRALLIVHPM